MVNFRIDRITLFHIGFTCTHTHDDRYKFVFTVKRRMDDVRIATARAEGIQKLGYVNERDRPNDRLHANCVPNK